MVINERQRAYLREMGIEVWERRAVDPDAVAAASSAAKVAETDVRDMPRSAPTGEAHADRVARMNWDELERTVKPCTRCPLHQGRTQTVFGVGNRRAEWMIIGEAPGAEEDRQGEPFVGRAGQLLNSMLAAIGLKREEVYIANILKCRPPGNRDPKPEEESACRDYLERQIRLVRPRIILAVGRIAAQNLMRVDTPIGKMRGRVYEYQELRIPVVITYHPAYLLRSPLEKRKAWRDLLLAKSVRAGMA
ncbi:MAG: uracil-DNA glycosylase [Chromatiales bacterium]